MAFLSAELRLRPAEAANLARLAAAAERTALALDAIVAKMNEPDPEDPQPAIDALVAKLAQSNTTLADEVAKILSTTPQGA